MQIGRVAIINSGPLKGKFAVILNVIDHKRVLIDSAQSGDDYTDFSRQVYPTRHLRLMKYRLVIRHDEGHERVKTLWEENAITRRLLGSKYMLRQVRQQKVNLLHPFTWGKPYFPNIFSNKSERIRDDTLV